MNEQQMKEMDKMVKESMKPINETHKLVLLVEEYPEFVKVENLESGFDPDTDYIVHMYIPSLPTKSFKNNDNEDCYTCVEQTIVARWDETMTGKHKWKMIEPINPLIGDKDIFLYEDCTIRDCIFVKNDLKIKNDNKESDAHEFEIRIDYVKVCGDSDIIDWKTRFDPLVSNVDMSMNLVGIGATEVYGAITIGISSMITSYQEGNIQESESEFLKKLHIMHDLQVSLIKAANEGSLDI